MSLGIMGLVFCLDPPTSDQIALDDSRVQDSQLARAKGVCGETTTVAEETHLASSTVLAQFSLHRPITFTDGPERFR
jgi:hypothetical protein